MLFAKLSKKIVKQEKKCYFLLLLGFFLKKRV